MTDCSQYTDDFDAYRDDRLEEHRQMEVHEHLQNCKDCQQAVEQAAAIERDLRQQAQEWVPPNDLWSRIKHSADREQSSDQVRDRHFFQIPWAAAALLVMAVGIVSFFLTENSRETESERVATALVNEFHTFVVSHRELDYPDSQPSEIRRWFGDKVNFRVPLPVQAEDLRLEGGRLCNMFDQRIASFMYQVDDIWVSLYIMGTKPHKSAAADTELLLQGYAYIDWENQGLHYSLVGGVSLERLREIATSLRTTQLLTQWQKLYQVLNSGKTDRPYRLQAGATDNA